MVPDGVGSSVFDGVRASDFDHVSVRLKLLECDTLLVSERVVDTLFDCVTLSVADDVLDR